MGALEVARQGTEMSRLSQLSWSSTQVSPHLVVPTRSLRKSTRVQPCVGLTLVSSL